jgi:hypothetical protein
VDPSIKMGDPPGLATGAPYEDSKVLAEPLAFETFFETQARTLFRRLRRPLGSCNLGGWGMPRGCISCLAPPMVTRVYSPIPYPFPPTEGRKYLSHSLSSATNDQDE